MCEFDVEVRHPGIAALLRLTDLLANRAGAWKHAMTLQASAESRSLGPGSQAMLARMSEMMFVDAVRR